MKCVKFLVFFVLLNFANEKINAQNYSPKEAKVALTIRKFTKALEDGDTAVLRRMTDPRLSYGHSSCGNYCEKAR